MSSVRPASGAEGTAPARPRAAEVAALVLLAILPFLNGLRNDFTYDDGPIIRDNARIATPANLPELFTTHYFGGPLSSGTAYRPLVLLTYGVQRWVHGLVPEAFRAVNVVLHAGVTALLFSWLLAVGLPRGPSFGASALFAVAAIHVEAITSIVGRAETLAALLVLLAARLWVAAARGDGPLRRGPYAGALASFLAAVFVKENAVVLPGVVLLGELFAAAAPPGSAAAFVGRLRRRALPLAGLLVPVALLFAVRLAVLEGFLISRQAGITELENPIGVLPAPLRAANALLLLARYAGKCLVPVGLAADHSGQALALVSSPLDGRLLVALSGTILVLGGSLLALRRRPAVPFGVLFFLGTMLPTSNLLFSIGTIYAERLVYLPSAGLFLAVVALLLPAGEGARQLPSGGIAALLAAAVLVQGGLAALRNRDWKDDATLYADQVAKFPRSAKARYNLAFALVRQGRREEALAQLGAATELAPGHFEAWGFRGKLLGEAGRPAESLEACRRALALQPAHELSLWGEAKALEAEGKGDEALAAFDRAARLVPASYPVAYHRARLLLERGDAAGAEREVRRALVLSGRAPEALLLEARILRRLGRRGESDAAARAALAASPRWDEAKAFLAGR